MYLSESRIKDSRQTESSTFIIYTFLATVMSYCNVCPFGPLETIGFVLKDGAKPGSRDVEEMVMPETVYSCFRLEMVVTFVTTMSRGGWSYTRHWSMENGGLCSFMTTNCRLGLSSI